MKPAIALFAGIFASGLALASFVEPTTHTVTCRSFYTFTNSDSTLTHIEGPRLADKDQDGNHRETVIDRNLGITLSFEWNEASNFRDIHAKILVQSDRGVVEAATYGKPSTAVHLTDLVIPTGQDQSLTAVSLFCGIAPQF